MTTLTPIEHSLVAPITPADAFELFTSQIARWWPLKSNSCSHDPAAKVYFEPHVGGSVTEIAPNGERHPWGVLTEWDPPRAFAMRWHPGKSAEQATELAIRFVKVANGCEVYLQHGGWDCLKDQAEKAWDGYRDGWTHVLQLFAAATVR